MSPDRSAACDMSDLSVNGRPQMAMQVPVNAFFLLEVAKLLLSFRGHSLIAFIADFGDASET